MAKTIFDPTLRAQLSDRITRLRPDSQRRWGTMSANQMVCHLEDAMKCATGITPTKSRKLAVSNPVLRWLIIYVMPWPKGKVQTSREMLLTKPGEFEADRRRLLSMLEETAQRGVNATWFPHPAFGNLNGRDYGALLHRHVDYHLRQFGV